jgi:hypothetical protein
LHLSSEPAVIVRQLEEELTAFDANWNRAAEHIGGVRRAAATDYQRASRRGPKPALRFPESGELVDACSLRVPLPRRSKSRAGNDSEDPQKYTSRHSSSDDRTALVSTQRPAK